MKTTNSILMIRPANFAYNPETAVNNKFQQATAVRNVQDLALKQFDNMVVLLQSNGIDVNLFQDTAIPETPDAIFPNNWISFHEDGSAILYPMFAQNRRTERRSEILQALQGKFQLNKIIDLSYFEKQNLFLEGTGSMILDRDQKIAYMCLSPRSTREPLLEFCRIMGYTTLVFSAVDRHNYPIYHTNVMLCVGTSFAVVCTEAIKNDKDRIALLNSLQHAGKEIVNISYQQMAHFAGNMLQLANNFNDNLLVLSEQAYLSLNKMQLLCLEKHAKLLYAPLDIIEKNGGGSARCMIAELFLPIKKTTDKTIVTAS